MAIEETIELVSRESFEHLVHEGKWEMVLSSSLIQLSVVDAHSPPSKGTLVDWVEVVAGMGWSGNGGVRGDGDTREEEMVVSNGDEVQRR
ncbi:hypothetical protein Tco_0367689 [Tanacetum coccineum]